MGALLGSYRLTGLPLGDIYSVTAGLPFCDIDLGTTATTSVEVSQGDPHVEGIDFTLAASP